MNPVLLVCQRELAVRVRSTTYVLATLLGPVLVGAMAFLPVLVVRLDRPSAGRIAIVDETGTAAAALARAIEQTSAFEVVTASGGEQGAREALRNGTLDGYLRIPRGVWSGATPAFYGRDPDAGRDLERVLSTELARLRMAREGLDPTRVTRLSRPVGVQTYRLDERGTRAEIADRSAVALPLVTVLYFMVLLYGMSIMTSVTEEKANRTAELLFSSVRPFELLGGKLLGVGAAALLQTTVWGLAALAVVALAPRAGGLGELARLGPGAWTAFAFFLSAGFLLYGTLYLAMGAIAGSTEEAQHLNLPVTAFAALGFFLSIYVMDRPDTTLAIVLSLVPLFAPMLLFARLIVSGVPAWQMVVGVALLAAAIAANLGIAARIYRTAMLLHGRRPRVSELAAWLRRS